MTFGLETHLSTFVLIFSTLCFVLAIIIRCKGYYKNINLADPFFLFVGFFYLYNSLSRIGRIKYDNLPLYIYEEASVLTLVSWIGIIAAAILLPYPNNTYLKPIQNSYKAIFWTTGFVLLGVGYYSWGLNFSRVGGILDSIINTPNRVDRNAELTEKLGNYPYTHFMYAAQIFLTIASLLTFSRIAFIILIPLLLISPLLSFYVIDGERTALLKHFIGGFYAITFLKFHGRLYIRSSYLVLMVGVFLFLAVLGNLRGGIQHYISTGDMSKIERQLEFRGVSILMPFEFSAVNYTYNQIYADVTTGKTSHSLGSTYFSGIGYLFPRTVYRALGYEKAPTISDEFGDQIAQELQNSRKMGFGMSALAESFLNFNFWGMFLYPVLSVLVISGWIRGVLKSQSGFLKVYLLTISPIFLLFHRISFASAFAFVIHLFVIIFFFYMMVGFVLWLKSNFYVNQKN